MVGAVRFYDVNLFMTAGGASRFSREPVDQVPEQVFVNLLEIDIAVKHSGGPILYPIVRVVFRH